MKRLLVIGIMYEMFFLIEEIYTYMLMNEQIKKLLV